MSIEKHDLHQTERTNRAFVLDSRPKGDPLPSNFRLETTAVPMAGNDQVLLRTVYLSLDPYMRGRMSDAPSYASPVALGEVPEVSQHRWERGLPV